MTEETKEETQEESLSLEERVNRIGEIVFQNNRILNSMLEALNQRQPATGPHYPAGYPNTAPTPPGTPPAPPAPPGAPGGTVPLSTAAPTAPAAYSNAYSEEREYIGAEEQQRTARTYTDMGNLMQPGPETAGPPPTGAPQPQPTVDERTVRQAPAAPDGGERLMTPDEYRNENAE